MPEEKPNDFYIWGIDDAPYGPVELPALVDWIKDERVLADTWVYSRCNGTWQRASDIVELQMFFAKKAREHTSAGITPGALRRIKILAMLNDAQLSQLSEFMEVQKIPQWSLVVHQGEFGDAMFMILEGELRARVMVADKETILATFSAGDFFGDMSLFDHGPRSADVVANIDSVLLKISGASFERMTKEVPALATPFLQATSRTLAARIRADNKRLGQVSQQFSAGGRA